MNKKSSAAGCFAIFFVLLLLLGGKACLYTVSEKEQVIITRFGEAQGEPIKTAGIKFKLPFVDKVNRISKQILGWDGYATEMPTKDKTYISVDTYARWRIVDAIQYFEKLREQRRAISRLDDILGSETRNSIAKHELIEVIRTTKDRTPEVSDELTKADMTGKIGKLLPIRKGRSQLEKEIFETSKVKLGEFGIELLDVRFKRINYNSSVRLRIYERMVSERQQIAERFRSEGAGEASKILGNMEKDLAEIESAAYKTSETIKGEADAKASDIYAKAYGTSERSAEFYEFVKTMALYEKMLSGKSTVVLSTDSDMFKYLKSVEPSTKPADAKPAPQKAAQPAPRIPAPAQ
ncbi:MAG: protease modulator HflC [Verrucomicrobiales bacterium]|nr:protease modulator HflC [Verrucomicrobiales bacterium]